MNKFSLVLVSVLFVALGMLNAAAKPPKPPADCGKDADSDGWCVADTDRGNKLVGTEDCNDKDPKVNPGASEVMDDGIDNDCVDGDLEAPTKIKAFGCSSAKCVSRVLKEIEACEADKTKCVVNLTAGKFVTEWGSYFVDTDCDGVREVLDQDEKDSYDAELLEGSKRRCGSSGGAKKAGTGTSGAASKPDPKVDELEGTVTALHSRVGAAETGLTELTDKLVVFTTSLDGLDEALEAETAERKAADELLAEGLGKVRDYSVALRDRVDDVDDKANLAESTAKSALNSAEYANTSGVSAGVDVGLALIGQSSVSLKGGKEARPGLAPTILLGGHVGAETDTGLYRALAAVGVPFETAPGGNTENGFLWTAGVEPLFKLARGSAHSVGPIVRFIEHESGGDVLGVNAKSRGATGGIAYSFEPQFGRFRVPIHVSLEAGAEQVGTQGHDDGRSFRAIGVEPMGLLSITFGGGTGSAIR